MKNGDLYQHYKGGLYVYLGMAVPITDNSPIDWHYTVGEKVTYEETMKPAQVYVHHDGQAVMYFIEDEYPYVIFQSTQDETIWARRADVFFGPSYTLSTKQSEEEENEQSR